jgi:ribosomal protein S27E
MAVCHLPAKKGTNIAISNAYPAQDLWPDTQTVGEVDDLLKKRWLLDFQPDVAAIKKRFPEIDDALLRFEDAEHKAVAKAGPQGVIDERELFRLLAHPGVFAHKAIVRRHYILDGIAFAVGLLRLYQLKGAVLDVGCHIRRHPPIVFAVSKPYVSCLPCAPSLGASLFMRSDPGRVKKLKYGD